LQISHLPPKFKSAEIAAEFRTLISCWLDFQRFSVVDLRPVIKSLHRDEESGRGEVVSHGIDYRTMEGRQIKATSASSSVPLLGEPVTDTALGAFRKSCVGLAGNFYWKTGLFDDDDSNPLLQEVHVIIRASLNEVYFPTANSEEDLRYVLSRIREHRAKLPRFASSRRAS
jgi:hypothetical protein